MRRTLTLSLLLLALGCPAPEEATPAPADKPPATSTSAPAATRLEGTLHFRELPPTRSVEAYMGVEFTLVDAAGVEHPLEPSASVSRDDLMARDGQRVAVTGAWRQPPPPDPRSAYPTGPDGAPLERPARLQVATLEPFDG